jgi:hypothetical protein
MSDRILYNGNLVGWSSYLLKINGLSYTNLTEVSDGDKLERAYGYGMSRSHKPIGKTPGKYTPDPLKIKFYQHSRGLLMNDLVQTSPDNSLANVPDFPVFLQYLERETTSSTLFVDCSVTSIVESITESNEGVMCEVEFMPLYIERDGITLFRPDLVQF